MALVTGRSLFVHVPKTGGSTVRAMMRAGGLQCAESGHYSVEDHYGLPELRAAHPSITDGRLTFGFVRHPVAWLRSRWAWAMVTKFPEKIASEPAAAAHWMADCWSERFDVFAAQYLERHPGACTRTCFRLLGLWTDAPAQRIGRTESLTADLVSILQEAGESFDEQAMRRVKPEKVAASDGLAELCALPPEVERRIMRAEMPLCERFGYDTAPMPPIRSP